MQVNAWQFDLMLLNLILDLLLATIDVLNVSTILHVRVRVLRYWRVRSRRVVVAVVAVVSFFLRLTGRCFLRVEIRNVPVRPDAWLM